MQSLLNDIVVANFYVFLLIFMRFGLVLMIMPGIGDSFVSPQVRLLFALSFTFILTPVLGIGSIPPMPAGNMQFVGLFATEAFIGLFIGTVMRILVSALDTAGVVVSIQSGFSNATVFNPVTATQGAVTGALYSMLGVTLIMATDLHHFLLASIVESYRIFPVNGPLPEMGSFLEIIERAVSAAFLTGIQMSMPFIVVGLLLQIGLGVMGRLMPQLQIFFLAMPLQIGLSLILIALVLSTSMMFWLNMFSGLTARFLEL